MRYGVTFSHPDMGDDPGFFKEFAQSVEGAGFDHLVAAARHRRSSGPADRREGPHLRRAVPRAVRALRLPRRGHRAHRADHGHPHPPAAPDRPRRQAVRGARPAHGRTPRARRRRRPQLDGVRSAQRGLHESGRVASRSRSRCCDVSGPKSSSRSRASGTTSIAWASTRCRSSGRFRSGWARGSARSSRRCCDARAAWPTDGCRSIRRVQSSPTRSRGCGDTRWRPAAIPPRSASRARSGCNATRTRRSGSISRRAYADLGATHLRVMTAGGGYETPAEHLAAALTVARGHGLVGVA